MQSPTFNSETSYLYGKYQIVCKQLAPTGDFGGFRLLFKVLPESVSVEHKPVFCVCVESVTSESDEVIQDTFTQIQELVQHKIDGNDLQEGKTYRYVLDHFGPKLVSKVDSKDCV